VTLVFALAFAATGGAQANSPCLATTPQPGPGSPAPFRTPDARATELNAAGKTLYRDGKWEEARVQYRASAAADPEFLAPRLNIACSFVRQERFREATTEVVALVDRAYVPWAREVLEAADLGALKARPEMAEIQRAIDAAALRWGSDLDTSLLYVARQRPPLRIPPTGEGVFILNPHQEIWAFAPAQARYRQVTAEEGRVLAMARSKDGRGVAYVTAEKLVRGPADAEPALRGVVVRELALGTVTAGAPVRVEGDVRRIEIAAGGGGFVVRVDGDRTKGLFRLDPSGTLQPWPERARTGPPLVVLTGRGAAAAARTQRFGGGCGLVAREAPGSGGTPILLVGAPGKKPVAIESGQGAGLVGLPIP
jgi:hypothetical protein